MNLDSKTFWLRGLVPVLTLASGAAVALVYSNSPLAPKGGAGESGAHIGPLFIGLGSAFLVGAYLGAMLPKFFIKKLDYYPLSVACGVATGLFIGLMIPLYGGPLRLLPMLTAYFGGRLAMMLTRPK